MVVPSRQASVVAEVRARQAVAEGGVARGRHRAGVAEVAAVALSETLQAAEAAEGGVGLHPAPQVAAAAAVAEVPPRVRRAVQVGPVAAAAVREQVVEEEVGPTAPPTVPPLLPLPEEQEGVRLETPPWAAAAGPSLQWFLMEQTANCSPDS